MVGKTVCGVDVHASVRPWPKWVCTCGISILITANTATLATIISALNGLFPTDVDDNSQLVQASLAAGASGTDTILTPQAQQFVVGNYDGEAHTITPANLSTFFGTSANKLDEGDALCIQYATMNDPLPGPPLGGRRQSIPENGNTTIPAGSFFNSRVHPERLVNAIPIGKVLNGRFVFMTGPQIPKGASNVDLGGLASGSVSWGPGAAWADGTTNPATDVGSEVSKIITDLGGTTGTGGIAKIGAGSQAYSFGTLAAQTLAARLLGIDAAKANLATINAFTRQQQVKGATDIEAAIAHLTAPSSAFRLAEQFNANTTTVRFYASSSGALFVTVNATWNNTTSLWHQDNTSIQSYGFYLDFANFKIKNKPSGTSSDWADGTWVSGTNETNGALSLVSLIASGLITGDRVRAAAAADPGTGNIGGVIGIFGNVRTNRTASRTLVWETSTGSQQNFRFYRTNVSGFEALELVCNATWNGSAWAYDLSPTSGGFGPVGPTAWRIVFNSRTQGIGLASIATCSYAEKYTVASTWADNAWDYTAGGIDFGGLIPSTAGVNTLTPFGMVKAWCNYTFDGTNFTINGSFNVGSMNNAFGVISVNFSTPFANANYAGHLQLLGSNKPSGFTNAPTVQPYAFSTASADFGLWDGGSLLIITSKPHSGVALFSGMQ